MAALLTLSAIRAKRPCESGWRKLLAHLGKTVADDRPLSMLTVLESTGLDETLWCLRCVKGRDGAIRMLACDFAQEVAHFNADPRVQAAIDTARRYASGDATSAEMASARKAAWAASAMAADFDASEAAAWAAAETAAYAAAADAAANDAAHAAARAAMRAARRAATLDAAWSAAIKAAYGAQTAILRRWIIQQEAA